jgi:hypothetical protein
MKNMNQSIFDVWAMKFIESHIENGEFSINLIHYYAENTKHTYSDAKECAFEFDRVCKSINSKYERYGNFYKVALVKAIELRMELNDDMETRGAMKKILGGSFFSKSHENPSVRTRKAIENISSLLDYQLSKI